MSLVPSRRQFLRIAAGLGAGALSAAWLTSCTPKATPVPEQKPAEEKPAAAEKPATQAPAPAATIEIRYMDRGDALGEFMRVFSRIYEERNPGITIKNESAGWSDLVSKVPTYVAADTMADVAFQWSPGMLPELGKKGAWLDLTPLAEKEQHDFSIYWPWALASLKQGPQDELVAMPMGVHNGVNDLMWNVEMLQDYAVGEPRDDMTMDEFTELLIKIQEKMPEPGYAAGFADDGMSMDTHSRSFGGYIISPDRAKCGLDLPETLAAHQWYMDCVLKNKVVPNRDAILASTKQMFYSSQLAIWSNCAANAWVGFAEATEGKWHMGHCIWPHGGGGKVGSTPACDSNVIYHKSKYPDECWGLLTLLSSPECCRYTAMSKEHMTPGAVIEMWNDPEIVAANPCYGNNYKYWISMKPEDYGSISVPANCRRAEFWDYFNNEWTAYKYGDKPFDQAAVDRFQGELQAIMDKPLP